MQFLISSRTAVALLASVAFSFSSFAQNPQDCSKVPDYNKLKAALTSAVKEGKGANGGLGNQEWGAVSESRWHRLRRCVHWPESRSGMAGKSPRLCGKGEYGKRLQHRQFRSFEWQYLFRCSAGQLPVQHRKWTESEFRVRR